MGLPGVRPSRPETAVGRQPGIDFRQPLRPQPVAVMLFINPRGRPVRLPQHAQMLADGRLSESRSTISPALRSLWHNSSKTRRFGSARTAKVDCMTRIYVLSYMPVKVCTSYQLSAFGYRRLDDGHRCQVRTTFVRYLPGHVEQRQRIWSPDSGLLLLWQAGSSNHRVAGYRCAEPAAYGCRHCYFGTLASAGSVRRLGGGSSTCTAERADRPRARDFGHRRSARARRRAVDHPDWSRRSRQNAAK